MTKNRLIPFRLNELLACASTSISLPFLSGLSTVQYLPLCSSQLLRLKDQREQVNGH
jgi:hypothetical protein